MKSTFKVWRGGCLKCGREFERECLGRPRFCAVCHLAREIKRRIRRNEAILWMIVRREVRRNYGLDLKHNGLWRKPHS